MSEMSVSKTSQDFRAINAENRKRYPSSSVTEESDETDDTENYVIDKGTHSDNISIDYDLDVSSTPKSIFSEDTDTKELYDVILEKNLGQEPPVLFEEELELREKQPSIDSNEDDDVSFFNSLLPYVKKLPPEQKLQFRMQVQKYVYDLSFSPNRSNDCLQQIPFSFPPSPPPFSPTTDLSQHQWNLLKHKLWGRSDE